MFSNTPAVVARALTVTLVIATVLDELLLLDGDDCRCGLDGGRDIIAS